MEFVTEAWQPVNMTKIRQDYYASDKGGPMETYEVRHWLVFVGLGVLALAPVVGMLSQNWGYAALLGSLGLLSVSAATILVPDEQTELDGYESGEDRRGT